MSITVQAVNDGIRDKLRWLGWRNPEWWVVMAAAVAWLFVAGISHTHASHTWIATGRDYVQHTLGVVSMVIAMMVPLTITNVRHVAQSSLWRRRNRAIAPGTGIGFAPGSAPASSIDRRPAGGSDGKSPSAPKSLSSTRT